MNTDLIFSVTNPDGSTVYIDPTTYKTDWPLNGHQQLTFECYDGEQIDSRATIKVTKAGVSMPVFCGWFARFVRPSKKSEKPQQYRCYGHSRILDYRYSFKKTYLPTGSIASFLGDTVASQGILLVASSLAKGWELITGEGIPANTYQLLRSGTDALYNQRIAVPTPTIYLGTTEITAGSSLANLQVNEYWRTTDRIYLRTNAGEPDGNPDMFPCYILNHKNCHLRTGSVPTDLLSEPGQPVTDQKLCYTFQRLVEDEGLEFSFVNRSDGDQDLDADKIAIYRGWYDDPHKTYVEADLIDYETGTLEDSAAGFDSILVRGRSTIDQCIFWPRQVWGRVKALDGISPLRAGVFKEFVPPQTIRYPQQLINYSKASLGQIADENYLKIWVRPDYELKVGDFVRTTITSTPYNGQYDMRILKKSFKNLGEGDTMELTLFDGFNEEG